MSETISGSVNANEQVENTAEAVENNGETVASNNAEEALERYVVGDIFAYVETSSLAMVILDVVAPNNGDVTYKMRLYSSVVESIVATEKEVANYIASNGLERLVTERDRMSVISKKIILKDGDVFTQNGEEYLNILSSELLYIDDFGNWVNVVGCQFKDGVVAFRNSLWVKAQIYGNTDQFPPEVYGESMNVNDNEQGE